LPQWDASFKKAKKDDPANVRNLFLIKYGEISLKGQNRQRFEQRLVRNLKSQLHGIPNTVSRRAGRLYLETESGYEEQTVTVLKKACGIVGFCKALQTEKDITAIGEAALELAGGLLKETPEAGFKIEARRTDKGFPYTSYQIACEIGDLLRRRYDGLSVNVSRPDWVINIEIREKAFICGPTMQGIRGLPVGSNGKGLLLLSGGIDSPVAGFLMAKRGLSLDALYFHTPPYTSEKVLQKVRELCRVLCGYIPGLRLLVADFTDTQLAIKERGAANVVTLFSRASMMNIAARVAPSRSALCLVTGESLGQVASQTPESMRFSGSFSPLPVFRPLIGMDKEDTIKTAKAIGSYELSIQPFPDCCTLFAPEHPLIRPDFQRVKEEFSRLLLDDLLDRTAQAIRMVRF
jgi:thiamine biosynthesis protein ThiI